MKYLWRLKMKAEKAVNKERLVYERAEKLFLPYVEIPSFDSSTTRYLKRLIEREGSFRRSVLSRVAF